MKVAGDGNTPDYVIILIIDDYSLCVFESKKVNLDIQKNRITIKRER